MTGYYSRLVPRCLALIVMAFSASLFCTLSIADEAAMSQEAAVEVNDGPGMVGLGISGSSAGITSEYFEQTLIEAIHDGHIFSGVSTHHEADVILPMIRADGFFPSTEVSGDTPYFLTVRIIRVNTPSFGFRMEVGMQVMWTLYHTASKAVLFNEKIISSYTGGVFEGGIHGANRVRVAMEGAARENIRTGLAKIAALDLVPPSVPGASTDEASGG